MGADILRAKKFQLLRKSVRDQHVQETVPERPFVRYSAWQFLIRFASGAGTTLFVLYFASGIRVDSLYAAIMVSVLIGLTNASIPYIVGMFSFAVSLITIGLFSLMVNIFMLYILSTLHIGLRSPSLTVTVATALTIAAIAVFITLALDSQLIIKS